MCLNFLPPEKSLVRDSRKLSARFRVTAHDLIDKMDQFYVRNLRLALGHRRLVIGTIVGGALLSLILVKFIGTEFFPDQDEGQFSVTVKLPVGTRSEVTDKFVSQVEKIIKENVPEAQTIIADIGVP